MVRNRIVMAPMATNLASAFGEASDALIAYYASRAQGGTGLIIVENATIEHRQGGNGAVQIRLDADRYVPRLYRLTEAIHAHGSAAAIQINHAGAVARCDKPQGPSDVPWTSGRPAPRPLTREEIPDLIGEYAKAAVRARQAGFDAVEIHGAHGYLIAQFLSPRMNRRNDAYGGSPERRWRFALEVVSAVRSAVGERFPLLFRVSGDEYLPDGRGIEETCELARALADAGIDAIHVTAATAANPRFQLEPMAYPEAWRIDLAAAVKHAAEVPVIGVGVIRTPQTAERILAEEKADFVAVGRGLIADPQWANKAAGRISGPIHRCISCNRCVQHRVFEDLPIRCSVNPSAGRELEPSSSCLHSQRVVVVGGGPAGLTAAAEAERLGHGVTLFEAGEALGGRLRVASQPPHKEKVAWLIEDLVADLPKAVDVKLGVDADAASVGAMAPTAVIVATGATPAHLAVPGAELPHVRSADAVLLDVGKMPDDVVVVGGGMVGCETALFCSARGARVTIVEMLDAICSDCEPITRSDIVERLGTANAELLTGTAVVEITPAAVAVDGDGGRHKIRADLVVCAVGSNPRTALAKELSTGSWRLLTVGDAVVARGICEAIHEGWQAARSVAVGKPMEGD